MRLAVAALIAALVALAAPAGAPAQAGHAAQTGQADKGTNPSVPKTPPQRASLWEQMVEPNTREVAAAYSQALIRYEEATNLASRRYPSELLQAMLGEARDMLAYAEGLDPENLEVIALLAAVDHELGNIDQALAGYERFALKAANPSHPVCLRHGYLLARLGQVEQAISRLAGCVAAAPDRDIRSWEEAVVLLVCLHSYAGNKNAALDVLEQAARRQSRMAQFALAVVYDQDGQLTRAHNTLEAMRAQAPLELDGLTLRFLEQRFYPAAERHYYMALLYEAADYPLDARAEWQSYLLHDQDARFRGRAQRHVEAIDALMQGSLAAPGQAPRRPRARK